MRKVGFICVYEDEDYIEQCILSCKDRLDALLVIEGAFQCTLTTNGKPNGKTARSSDKTLDIVKKYVDNKKVFLLEANEQEHKYQYQIGLDWAKANNSDWAIMIDSDEVWTKQAWDILDSKLKIAKDAGIFEYRIKQYCFINDFKHYYNGEYPRVFRVTPKAYFVADNEVAWPDFGKIQDCGRTNEYIHLLFPTPLNYHYGYVRKHKRWKLKQDSLLEKDGNPINLQYKLEEDKYIIPSDIPIFEFKGQHPEIMRKHSFHNLSAHDIIYGE